MPTISFKRNPEKEKAAFLYIAERVERKEMHNIFKTLYWAEQMHLVRYARPITFDRFTAMENGPVPSDIYDQVKYVRDGADLVVEGSLASAIQVKDKKNIIVLEEADVDELSESDIECLDESIEKYSNLSYAARTRRSHDEAWEKAWKIAKAVGARSEQMDYLEIAKVAGASEEVIKSIILNSEDSRLSLH